MQPQVLQVAQGSNAVRQHCQAGGCASDGQLLKVGHASEVVRELLQQGAREAQQHTGHAANNHCYIVCHHGFKLRQAGVNYATTCALHMRFLPQNCILNCSFQLASSGSNSVGNHIQLTPGNGGMDCSPTIEVQACQLWQLAQPCGQLLEC